jgi:hypothetical protein
MAIPRIPALNVLVSAGVNASRIVFLPYALSPGAPPTPTMMLIFSGAPEGCGGETVGLRLMVNNIARIAGPALFGAIGALSTWPWCSGSMRS